MTLKGSKHAIPAPMTFNAPGANKLRSRPKLYTERVAKKICERIMRKESLSKICEDPRMPSMQTVIRWFSDDRLADFREMYYYARRVQAELRVDEIFEIADDVQKDWKPVFDKDQDIVDWTPDNEAIQRSKVRIETRKWYASKMLPRLYGDKVELEHGLSGELKEMLQKASNNSKGLPKAVNE